MKKIEWNEVTRFSQIIALVVFIAVWGLGIYVGMYYQAKKDGRPLVAETLPERVIADVNYQCAQGKTARVIYHPKSVLALLSDSRDISLPQALSADGARYATANESIVFWNKGTTAFITEGTTTTFENCTEIPDTK